jgi:diguanylate cyclase (GGDEF)-like protein
MTTELDPLARQDRERHKEQAAAFWSVSLLLTLILLAAYPPSVALGAAAGWSIAAVFLVVTLAYVHRLRKVGGTHREGELLAAGVLAALALGIDQWLAGGFSAPLYLMFTIHLIGSAAVLQPKQRRIHLAAVELAVLAPLAYERLSWHEITALLVFAALLVIEAAMIADFGERLRSQRLELLDAERLASRLALTDPLTGMGNRRAFGQALESADAATVVYLDLDGFKAYNDRLGHWAGDALLERLGTALSACVAGRGQAFRIGGDEFCVLFHDTDGIGDAEVAEVVAALSERAGGIDISPSCGVVRIPGDARDPETALRLADERMYADKRARCASPASTADALADTRR